MSVKRIRVSDGVFTHGMIDIDLTKPHKDDAAAITEILIAATPESRIRSLATFAAAADLTDQFVVIRIEKLRDYLAQAQKLVDPNGDFSLRALDLIDLARQMQREIQALPYTRDGIKFRGSKRGLSLLYRKAVEILEREGVALSAKKVRQALEDANVIDRVESETLYWTDDKGRHKETSIKQFETNLSRHKQRFC